MSKLKHWTKSDVKFCLVIIFTLTTFFIIGQLVATLTIGKQAEAAIAVLRDKQPKTFKPFEGHEFDGNKFVSCIKNQKVVSADNTVHCLGQSAYKP